jgi:hypothetical protein
VSAGAPATSVHAVRKLAVLARVGHAVIASSIYSARARPADFLLKMVLSAASSTMMLYFFFGVLELGEMDQAARRLNTLFIVLLLAIDGWFQVLCGTSVHSMGRFVKERRMDAYFLRPHLSPTLLLLKETNLAALPAALVFTAALGWAADRVFGLDARLTLQLAATLGAGLMVYVAITCVVFVLPVLLGAAVETARGVYLASFRFAETPKALLMQAFPLLSQALFAYFAIAATPVELLEYPGDWIWFTVASALLAATTIVAVMRVACRKALQTWV